MKYVYLYRLENEDEEQHPVALTRPYAIALVVLVLGVILLGTVSHRGLVIPMRRL